MTLPGTKHRHHTDAIDHSFDPVGLPAYLLLHGPVTYQDLMISFLKHNRGQKGSPYRELDSDLCIFG
jgi:hypothetical protein